MSGGPVRPVDPPGRRRRSVRRLLSVLCLLAGLGLGVDVAATVLWQEPVSALVATVRRSHLDVRALGRLELGPASQAELATLQTVEARLAFLARWERATVPPGAALGRLRIDRIGLRTPIVEGSAPADLETAPGHYPSTGLPGQGGTVAIAGHRTTYLAPFRHLDALRPGDPIVVLMPYGRFTYTVQRVAIVAPTAWWILHPVGSERLVLSSCQPLFSAAQRIVVFARLSGVTPTALGALARRSRRD